MKVSIVTPVYHEQDNIVRAMDGIRAGVKTPFELLVVYDKEDDPTCDVVKRYVAKHKAKNIKLVKNFVGNGRGFLNALRSGFEAAKSEAVVTMMADLCDNPADVDRMYQAFLDGADVVCASRYMKGGQQIGSPLLKRTLSRVGGTSLYYLGRLPIHDVTNNFKLYRKHMLKDIRLRGEGGFEIAMEITSKAHKMGYTLVEIPTVWRDREAGEAKFNLRKMLPRYLRWYWFALKPGKELQR